MTVRIYRSTDAGAPVLTGQVGTLVALLDACLVNGYGTQAAAGWTKPYAAANQGAYKQNNAVSNNPGGMYLYVNDAGPGVGAAREARVCGFETMTAITPTGTGQFPTAAQSAIGAGYLVLRKSATADATARAWTLIANGATLYLFVETGDQTAPLGALPFVFGDFKSYKAGDQYAVGIIARQTENNGSSQVDPFQVIGGVSGFNLNSKFFGHFVARSWTALGGSVQCGKTIDYGKVGGNFTLQHNSDAETAIIALSTINLTSGRNTTAGQLATPNGPDGGLWLSPFFLFHHFSLRGYWPGLWAMLHDRPLTHNDTLTIAAGNLSGKSMVCQNFHAYILGATTSDYGQVLIEYSDTWS